MNRVLAVIFITCMLLTGCERKPKAVTYTKSEPEPYSNPRLTVKKYIEAINNNDFQTLNECHHPKSKLAESSGDFEKLKDTLKDLKVTKYEILKSGFSANGMRAQVIINWELEALDPDSGQVNKFSDKGRVIELERLGKKWLVAPHNKGRMFLSLPKVTTRKVDEKEMDDNGKEE